MRVRPYTGDDFDRVTGFLRDLYLLDPDRPYWLPARWEYATYLVSPLFLHRGFPDWTRSIGIWEDDEGAIRAIVNSENPDHQFYLHVHPSCRGLEADMLDCVEASQSGLANRAAPGKESAPGKHKVVVWTLEEDEARKRLLQERGYVRLDTPDYLLCCDLKREMEDIAQPEGYTVHTMLEDVNLEEKIASMTAAFRSDPYPPGIYRTMQGAPSYRPEFDFFARDARGRLASFGIVWVDESLQIAYFEPVCTSLDHQRKGLGRALINEALRRLRKSGIKKAYVGASGDWRRDFYGSAGFDHGVESRAWRKIF